MITVDCAPGEYWLPLPDDPILNEYNDKYNGWCKRCGMGEYQPDKRQKECKKCDTGLTTESVGTSRQEDCKGILLICLL